MVLIQEDADAAGDEIVLHADRDRDSNIRPEGGDFPAGARLAAPRRLRPVDLALLAAMNADRIAVTRRPVVALIPTGDELVMPGEDPGPDQIVSSNGVGLEALLEAAGAEVRLLPIARDTPESLAASFALTEGADLDRDARRRVGRRLRPGAEDRARPRHGSRLLPGGHAAGKAADGRAPRPRAAGRACRATRSRPWSPAASSSWRRWSGCWGCRASFPPRSRPASRRPWGRTAPAPTTCGRGSTPGKGAGHARPSRVRTRRSCRSWPRLTRSRSARRTIRPGRPEMRLNFSGFKQLSVVSTD